MVSAIVIARGGSKRLPGKNIRPFCGIPLVAWSIVQAQCSQFIDRVYLSTDSESIEAVGREYGAEIIRRPEWDDADQVAANRPFAHAIELIQRKEKNDAVVLILPTSPLKRPDDYDRAVDMYFRLRPADILGMATARETIVYSRPHPHIARLVMWNKRGAYMRDAGGFSVTSPEWYLNHVTHYSDLDAEIDALPIDQMPNIEHYFVPMEIWQRFEVDTIEEFELAEVIMEHYVTHGEGLEVYRRYAAAHKPRPDDDGFNIAKYAGNLQQQ